MTLLVKLFYHREDDGWGMKPKYTLWFMSGSIRDFVLTYDGHKKQFPVHVDKNMNVVWEEGFPFGLGVKIEDVNKKVIEALSTRLWR